MYHKFYVLKIEFCQITEKFLKQEQIFSNPLTIKLYNKENILCHNDYVHW